jgi:glycosyltransferase involved in cell wall biosynthesis
MTLFYASSILLCGLWSFVLIYMCVSVARMPLLREETRSIPLDKTDWPLLSIIVPACNEADHIEAALTSLLDQDYRQLEFVVINDRSSDGTGEIIERLAASDSRVRAVHIESLPKGWLGKVHALREGVREARGDWYLFTDADVYFQPSALRHAVGYALHHRLDHLACFPEIAGYSSFWLDVVVRSFLLLLCPTARIAEINVEGSEVPVGIGAFNLVSASAFKRTPGFEWLRMEPADDLGLGMMLKQSGARSRLLNADGEMRVPWYESVGAMTRGLEKNSFGTGGHYSYSRQLAIVSFLWLLAAIPSASLFTGLLLGDGVLLGAGAFAHITLLLVALVMPRKTIKEVGAYLCLPIGIILLGLILLRAAYKCLRNDGIDWRGTHYSLAELRRGQRLRF